MQSLSGRTSNETVSPATRPVGIALAIVINAESVYTGSTPSSTLLRLDFIKGVPVFTSACSTYARPFLIW